MKDDRFLRHNKVPMTKEEIRYVSLSYIDLQDKKNMLDVGAGTGSVSIEALIRNKDIKVTAIESDINAIDVINKNIEKFEKEYKNIKNRINFIEKLAPIELSEKYDAIFVGGTKGSVSNIIAWCEDNLADDGIMVLNFITLENFYEALDTISNNENLCELEGSQIMINKIEKLSKYKYLKPHNPVFVIKCKKKRR